MKASCLSNSNQIGLAASMYLTDSDGAYPQGKRTTQHPEIDDADGAYEEPTLGSPLEMLYPYLGSGSLAPNQNLSRAQILSCPTDPDPFGVACALVNPDAPNVSSYPVNGYFVFGLNENDVVSPPNTIYVSERRSQGDGGVPPYCDDIYRPWWDQFNTVAPENEMDPVAGAVATKRHVDLANYLFADTHVKTLAWSRTYAPPSVNLHVVR
jgi:prepilin-type processing-associated H-X9-DG protein